MSALGHRACPVVLAAPSGTGKTTIAHALVEGPGSFVFSVSATTRPPRPGERDGVDYAFLDEAEFRTMIDRGELAEWARVHGHLYGTPRRNLDEAAVRGEHVVLDIDVQGARQIRKSVPEAVLIFVFPPSAAALVDRLSGRGTEHSGEVARRLAAARGELRQAEEFDYVVVNQSLETAVEEVRGIVRSEGFRPARALDFTGEVKRLRKEIDQTLQVDARRV